jgi:phosphoribosylformimino-5-aminoimidazole carboxamide ribotide isomerase
MILLPAIDILDGRAVRLVRGEFDRRTVYDADPLAAARRFAADGARALHVVDLDGVRAGEPRNLEQVRRICAELAIPVQLGGGMRSLEAIQQAFAAGVARVLLGTGAIGEVGLLERALAQHGERIAVALDARGGRLATGGWLKQTELELEPAIEALCARGARRFVYSSIERDGTLFGPDLEGARRVARAARGEVVYSGGIGALEHLRCLAALGEERLRGVIVGKALYEGRFGVAEAQLALKEGERRMGARP